MRSVLSLSFFLPLLAWGCSPKTGDFLLLEVGSEKIPLREYEQFYERNVGSWDAAQKSSLEEREKFLDLLTNYKLKLRDAYARNLLNEPDVQAELRDYQASVATTFFVDRELTEPALHIMYERRKEEIRASHILLRLSPNAAPVETLKVWNRAIDIIKQINDGKDFGTLAAEMSEDPSARMNLGDLGYFTAGQLVKPFEDAVYALQVGKVAAQPSRTQFGYHIIKLYDRKPSVYTVNASHILISTRGRRDDSLSVDSAFQKIRVIRDSIKAGASFADLARRHSEDPGTAVVGGNLGFFQRRRFIPEFEQAAFALQPGEISDIVSTKFGYHLIKCDDVRSVPPYPEIRSELLQIYQRFRYNEEYRKFVDDLRRKYTFTRHENTLHELIPFIDSTRVPSDSLWAVKVPWDIRQKGILSVGERTITVDSLLAMMSSRADFRNVSLKPENIPLHVDKIGDFLVLETASTNLEQRYPDFKSLMKEFQDGVVLYKAEQQEVWNKLDVDEEKLNAFYTERRDQYTFPDRIEMVEISTEKESLAFKIRAEIEKGRNIDTVIARSKRKGGKIEKNTRGLIAADTDELTKKAWTNPDEIGGSFVGPVNYKNRYFLMKVLKKDAARKKTFEEASTEVSTAFQDYEAKRLEREWLERLRQQYPVAQHKEHLAKAFTGEKPSP